MKAFSFAICCMSALLLVASSAKALPLPDNSICSASNGACLTITNSSGTEPTGILGYGYTHTGTGVFGVSDSGAGVEGQAGNSGSWGVYGTNSAGIGTYGESQTYVGVYGYSNSSNGVVAQNARTDLSAAALSVIPGNSNGLAIWAGGVCQKPGGGSWSSTSDARVKKDVKDFRPGLAQLKAIRPVSYKYNGLAETQDDGNEYVGVIAQELEKILPSMVKSKRAKLRPIDSTEADVKTVDPSAFTYVLINAVQEQQRIIEAQEARIARLERGPAATMTSVIPWSIGSLVVGLAPLGLIAVQRKRREQE